MTNTTAGNTGRNSSFKATAIPAKALGDIATKQLSGRLTIQDPNALSVFWRVYLGKGQVHFATSATGQQERLMYLLWRYSPELEPPQASEFQSDYQYLCHFWQSGRLSLQKVRQLQFLMAQEALVQSLALPQAALQFERSVGLDPILLSVSLEQIVLPVRGVINQWSKLRPAINSPFARPVVTDKEQFTQYLRPKVRDAQQFQTFSTALSKNLCLYEVAQQLKIESLKLAAFLHPLVGKGIVRVDTPHQPQSDDRPIVACIDDSKAVQRNVKLTLEAAGYRVLGLSEPARALSALARYKPVLVLMDISMPDIDGYELCRRLRQSTLLKEIPIVMLTGRDGLIDRLRARMVGATDYITKPFNPQQLLSTVQKVKSHSQLEVG